MGSFEDLTNKRFGKLLIVSRADNNKHGQAMWLCKCDCGNEKILTSSNLNSGKTRSCGCQHKNVKDLVGNRFGILEVEEYLGNSKWKCKCDCGNKKITNTSNLKNGKTWNCGCKHRNTKDLTGNKYGMLEVIEQSKSKNEKTAWLCRCDCGNERVVKTSNLKNNTNLSCGCQNKYKFKDLTNQKFGRYLAINKVEDDKNNNTRWLCKCECGNERVVYTRSLITGESKSCGCLRKEMSSNRGKYKKPNTYIFFDDYIEVCTRSNEKFLIDKEDFYIIENRSCYIDKNYVRFNRKTLSRIIMDCPDDKVVDHINHDTLDNRKSNLRIVTHQQNMLNSSVNKNNTSGVKGVSWNKKYKKWNANIGFNGKNIYLGCYNDFEDAVKVREEAEIKYHGEFRNTSQPVL